MAVSVRDAAANGPERIEDAATAIGKGDKQTLFKAIYHGKSKAKKISDLLEATGLGYQRAIDCGAELVKKDVCEQTKKDGELAYVMIPFIQANKSRIIRIANDPKKLEKLPSARRVRLVMPKTLTISTKGAEVERVTIDDILSFARVRKVKFSDPAMPENVSEKEFKKRCNRTAWGGRDL